MALCSPEADRQGGAGAGAGAGGGRQEEGATGTCVFLGCIAPLDGLSDERGRPSLEACIAWQVLLASDRPPACLCALPACHPHAPSAPPAATFPSCLPILVSDPPPPPSPTPIGPPWHPPMPLQTTMCCWKRLSSLPSCFPSEDSTAMEVDLRQKGGVPEDLSAAAPLSSASRWPPRSAASGWWRQMAAAATATSRPAHTASEAMRRRRQPKPPLLVASKSFEINGCLQFIGCSSRCCWHCRPSTTAPPLISGAGATLEGPPCAGLERARTSYEHQNRVTYTETVSGAREHRNKKIPSWSGSLATSRRCPDARQNCTRYNE